MVDIETKTTDTTAFDSGSRVQFKPLGSSGTDVNAGYFSEEYLQKLRGRAGAKVYDEIRRSEAQVAMLLGAIMNPIKAGVWEFEAAADVVDSELHKEFIEHNAKDLIDWETHLHEALTMLIYGFSIFEVIHTVTTNEKFGTYNGLKSLAYRSQKTIERWLVDRSTGNLKAVEQWTFSDTAPEGQPIVRMDAQFLMVFTLQKEGDNYEGISILRPMYGPWFRKNLYLKIVAIGIEKNAIGTPMGTVPVGKKDSTELADFKELLSNFTAHESAYLVKPEGWEIEILKNDFDPSKVKEVIIQENTEMINSVVANFLALGTSGGGGSFALGTDLSDFFLTGIQNYANIIAGVWNRNLIPNLIKLNYGPQKAYPKLKATGINDKAGKELAEIISSLTSSEALRPDMKLEEFLRKQFSLPAADPSTLRMVQDVAPINANLPNVEAGQEANVDVQKLSLNGAQVASLLSIVQRVAIGLLPRESGVAAIMSAFNLTKEDAEGIMSNVGEGFAPNEAALQTLGAQLSETRLQLAENYKAQWKTDKEKVKAVMQENLKIILTNYEKQVRTAWKTTNPNARRNLAMTLEPRGLADYTKALREELARIANSALIGAKKETPQANKKNIKLSETIQLAAPRGGYYEALPPKIKNIIKNQAALIAQTQANDLNKAVTFQFLSSADATEDVGQVIIDIESIAIPAIEGATAQGFSVEAAAGNAVSSAVNQARLEWFFEPEVLDTIESFTFINEDPISEICQELDGTTWAVGDPDIDRYTPPLHHNCKSRLQVNEKGADKNPAISRNGTAVSEKALKSMTLDEPCGCGFGLKFGPIK